MKRDYKRQTATERKAEAKKSATWIKEIIYWTTRRFKRADKPRKKKKPGGGCQFWRRMYKTKSENRKRNRIARKSRRNNNWKRK